MIKKTYSLSGYPIKFCKVKLQLTSKKINPLQFIIHQPPQKNKNNH